MFNKLFKPLSILVAITLFAAVCGAQIARAAQPVAAVVGYEAVLGKSVSAQPLADFIAENCTPAGSMQYCQPAGLALWTDRNQIVRLVSIYLNDAEGFTAYKGELPLGLESTDTMADVEQKLRRPGESFSRDLTYYWATYESLGVTVVYNTPAAYDKDATIHAIHISK